MLKEVGFKKEVLNVMFGLLLVFVLIFIIKFFELGTWQIIIFLIVVNASLQVGFGRFNLLKWLKAALTILVFIWCLVWVYRLGWVGWFSGALLIALYILFRNRKKYLRGKHKIEKLIWGKPLKEFIKEGKRPPKVRLKKKK